MRFSIGSIHVYINTNNTFLYVIKQSKWYFSSTELKVKLINKLPFLRWYRNYRQRKIERLAQEILGVAVFEDLDK